MESISDSPQMNLPPREDEPICPITYEETKIRLGAGPETRPSFWKAYREELKYNRRTRYQNARLAICRPMLESLRGRLDRTFFFRNGELVSVDAPVDQSPRA